MDNRTLMEFVRDNELKVKGGDRYECLRLLNTFLLEEYDDTEGVDLDKLDDIGVMYSTVDVEDGWEQGLQVVLNISALPATLSLYLEGNSGDDYIVRQYFPTWKDVEDEVKSWDFDCLYSWAAEEYEYHEELNA